MARSTSDNRQLLYQQLRAPLGQTIGNIDQYVNLIKNRKGKGRKGKERKAKERATTTTTTTTTTIAIIATTINNNINHNRKEKPKEMVPSGATTTTTPAGARTSRATRTTTTKERASLHRRHRLQDAGFAASSDIGQFGLPHAGSTIRRTSTTSSNNNDHHNISSFSFRAHQISPSPTCLQRASLRSTSISYHNKQQPQLQYQQVRQALPSTTSASSVICDKSVHSKTSHPRRQFHQQHVQLRGRTTTRYRTSSLLDINQLNREHLWDLPRGLLRRWEILCDTGVVTSVAPRNFAEHVPETVPLQPHYTQLALSTAHPINPFTSMATKTSCSSAINKVSFAVRLYICDVKGSTVGTSPTSLTAGSSPAHQGQGIAQSSSVMER